MEKTIKIDGLINDDEPATCKIGTTEGKKRKKNNAMKRSAGNKKNDDKDSSKEKEADGGSPEKKMKTFESSSVKASKSHDIAPEIDDKSGMSKSKDNARKGGKKRSADTMIVSNLEANQGNNDKDGGGNNNGVNGGDGAIDTGETCPKKKKKTTAKPQLADNETMGKKLNVAKVPRTNNNNSRRKRKSNSSDFDFILTDENLEKIGAMSETECGSNETCFFEIERQDKLKNDAFIKVMFLKAPESIVIKGKNMHRINFNGYFSFHDKKTKLQVYNYESLTVDRGIEIVPFYLANDETTKSFAVTLWNRGEHKCEIQAGERIAVLVARNC